MRRQGLRALSGLILASGTLLAGCDTDELVTVTDPTLLTPIDIDNAASVPQLVQGAYVQLVGGYSGFGGDAFLSASAVISDEFYYGDTFTTRQAADSRNLQPTQLGNISDGAFYNLQSARFNSRRAFAAIAKYPNVNDAAGDIRNQAQLRTIEGYTYVTLSEGWCGAVPFSVVPDSGDIDPAAITEGVALTTAQMNDTAITRYDQALALNPNNSLARIGKARALLNLGRYAIADTVVAPVALSDVFRLEHSVNSGGQNNPIASLQQNGRYGVANLEGGTVTTTNATTGVVTTTFLRPDLSITSGNPGTSNATAEGLPFRGAQDPRIPTGIPAGAAFQACFTSSIRCFLNGNYPDFLADVPLASGVEARLVQAEAALQRNDPAAMFTILNALRASSTPLIAGLYPSQRQVFFEGTAVRPLAPLDPTAFTTAAQQRDILFRERAFWLFNTGHRQGDLRRLVRNYGLTTQQVFPTGPFFRAGLTYGNDVAYPVPFNEANNSKFVPGSCVTTQA